MAAASSPVSILADDNFDSNLGVDKLTYEIFSILENKFLFGCDPQYQNLSPPPQPKSPHFLNLPLPPADATVSGKVRILSIDAAGSTDGLLAAKSLSLLEDILRTKSGNPNAHISSFFDVVAGSGVGGVLAALLFTRGKDGLPIFSAHQALQFITEHGTKFSTKHQQTGIFGRVLGHSSSSSSSSSSLKLFKKVFGDLTLKDTFKAVLIPCYDLTTGATVLFSRADALEMDGCDFSMAEVCRATVSNNKSVELKSADGRKKMTAVGGGIAMNNPTAAAITHVLNNKQEFPFCKGVEDLLVVSLGNGETECSQQQHSSASTYIRIAGDGAADMVDQAVSMAFENAKVGNNYVRIQGNGIITIVKKGSGQEEKQGRAEAMLAQNNVESVLFKGKKLGELTNAKKLDLFACNLIKEQQRRKTSVFLPPVFLKQLGSPSSPRTSSATTLSTISSC